MYLSKNNYINNNSGKFESTFSFDQLNEISKWFKIFDSLEEVYEDMIKLMEKKQIQINKEKNCVNLVFNINMEKIKEFNILFEPKESTTDEIINNLVQENKELKTKVNNIEDRLNSLEKKLNELFSSDIIEQGDKINNWII